MMPINIFTVALVASCYAVLQFAQLAMIAILLLGLRHVILLLKRCLKWIVMATAATVATAIALDAAADAASIAPKAIASDNNDDHMLDSVLVPPEIVPPILNHLIAGTNPPVLHEYPITWHTLGAPLPPILEGDEDVYQIDWMDLDGPLSPIHEAADEDEEEDDDNNNNDPMEEEDTDNIDPMEIDEIFDTTADDLPKMKRAEYLWKKAYGAASKRPDEKTPSLTFNLGLNKVHHLEKPIHELLEASAYIRGLNTDANYIAQAEEWASGRYLSENLSLEEMWQYRADVHQYLCEQQQQVTGMYPPDPSDFAIVHAHVPPYYVLTMNSSSTKHHALFSLRMHRLR
jgi:hypothetical protein